MKKFKDKNWLIKTGIIVITILTALIMYIIKSKNEIKIALENRYNLAFSELINSVQNAETYLAKAQISTSAKSGAENLSNVWREAGIAQANIAQLPLTSSEIGNTAKFLNEISDYSYSLARKNMNGERLSDEDLSNIKQLYSYSVELENSLNQLATDFSEGRMKWKELVDTDTLKYATKVSSITVQNFENLDVNLHEYSGLIYDGAFSEHLNSVEKKGLTGDDINEEQAKEIAISFFGNNNVKTIESCEYCENADIPAYCVWIKLNKDDMDANISISKKGGHVISSNSNRLVETEIITDEDAIENGKVFLQEHGYDNMKETYFLKENGVMTVNYAYKQELEDGKSIVMYPDLIKVRIALDNGDILGIEATGYLNTHTIREIPEINISEEEARSIINSDVEIFATDLAVIPTKWKTEILCYEFKGRIDGNDFLVYINANTGKEEDVLLIVNTPNGTLTK